MLGTAVSPRRVRFPWVWFWTTTLCALLLFAYDYLDAVARQHRTPFYLPFIDEFTGVYGAALLFPVVRWIARRFPVGRRTWVANLPRHVGVLLVFSLVHTTWNWTSRIVLFRALGLGDYDYGLMPVRYLMELPIDIILYTLFVWGVSLFDRVAAQREAALRAVQLESQLRQAQLQGLRLQLQPHFLFNALNTISSAMYDDPRAADTMLAGLAELLRLSLRTTQRQEVPLATELEVLDHYVALQRGRFGDRLSLSVDVEAGTHAALVPSLILQPLVENAVRHGNLSRLGTGRIVVRARRVAERLRVEVEDDGPGPEAGVEVTTKGIGLAGTIERLRLLYGDAQQLDMRTMPGIGFRVAFELPLRVVEAPKALTLTPLPPSPSPTKNVGEGEGGMRPLDDASGAGLGGGAGERRHDASDAELAGEAGVRRVGDAADSEAASEVAAHARAHRR